MARGELTPKQLKFVEAYSGNGVEAARAAGYKGSSDVLKQVASENLAKPYVAAAIKNRQDKEMKPFIAKRHDRQKFWTDVMNDPEAEMRDRLRASELLGKSEADFVEKVHHSGVVTLESLVTQSLGE